MVNMGVENSIVILKPDALRRGIEYKILDRIQNTPGLDVADLYKADPDEATFKRHYDEVITNRPEVAEKLLRYIQSGPIIVAKIRGVNSIQHDGGAGGTYIGIPQQRFFRKIVRGIIELTFKGDIKQIFGLIGMQFKSEKGNDTNNYCLHLK